MVIISQVRKLGFSEAKQLVCSHRGQREQSHDPTCVADTDSGETPGPVKPGEKRKTSSDGKSRGLLVTCLGRDRCGGEQMDKHAQGLPQPWGEETTR